MKYILIIGLSNEGKSTIIDALCKKLNPTIVQRLIAEKIFEKANYNMYEG
jgi:ribosome biogenesis GTPase A